MLDSVHGPTLVGTVTGEAAERAVAVYLPPSYDGAPGRRYSVVYLLHGIGGTQADWTTPWAASGATWNTIQDVMDRGLRAGRWSELILVAPDASTRAGGSFYTNSSVTGGWEDFTVVDLVAHVDASYRTLTVAASRGIAGHSMGGYGAIKLGMQYPDVYGAVYALSPGVLGWAADLTAENEGYRRALLATPQSLDPRADLWPSAF